MPLKRDMHFRKLSAIVREALEIDALSVQTQMGMCAFLMATSGARQGVTGSRCVCVFVCVRVLMNLVVDRLCNLFDNRGLATTRVCADDIGSVYKSLGVLPEVAM